MLLSLTCIPHISPLGKSQTLSSFSLARDATGVKVGMSASFGTLVSAHIMMMRLRMGGHLKSFHRMLQKARGVMGLPLQAASMVSLVT